MLLFNATLSLPVYLIFPLFQAVELAQSIGVSSMVPEIASLSSVSMLS